MKRFSQGIPLIGRAGLAWRVLMTGLSIAVFWVLLAAREEILAHGEEAAPAASEGTIILDAIADTCVMEGYPSRNLGNAYDMWVGYDDYLDPDGQRTRGLIRFPAVSLPAGQQIITATLRLFHVQSWDFPQTFDTITAHRASGAWEEMSVTWNTAPAVGPAAGSASVPQEVSPPGEWRELDVTAIVRAWVEAGQPNYGIYLIGEEAAGPDSSWRSFSTRESVAIGGRAPQLVVRHGVPATATATASPTSTATRTHTPTATATSSPTSTFTAISSPTPTASPSPSPSPTNIPSLTPTATATETITHTPTPTHTSTGTTTPSSTPTMTATPSITLSITPSATPSPAMSVRLRMPLLTRR